MDSELERFEQEMERRRQQADAAHRARVRDLLAGPAPLPRSAAKQTPNGTAQANPSPRPSIWTLPGER